MSYETPTRSKPSMNAAAYQCRLLVACAYKAVMSGGRWYCERRDDTVVTREDTGSACRDHGHNEEIITALLKTHNAKLQYVPTHH